MISGSGLTPADGQGDHPGDDAEGRPGSLCPRPADVLLASASDRGGKEDLFFTQPIREYAGEAGRPEASAPARRVVWQHHTKPQTPFVDGVPAIKDNLRPQSSRRPGHDWQRRRRQTHARKEEEANSARTTRTWQYENGFTWHQVEDGQTLQLVPTVHNFVPHRCW